MIILLQFGILFCSILTGIGRPPFHYFDIGNFSFHIYSRHNISEKALTVPLGDMDILADRTHLLLHCHIRNRSRLSRSSPFKYDIPKYFQCTYKGVSWNFENIQFLLEVTSFFNRNNSRKAIRQAIVSTLRKLHDTGLDNMLRLTIMDLVIELCQRNNLLHYLSRSHFIFSLFRICRDLKEENHSRMKSLYLSTSHLQYGVLVTKKEDTLYEIYDQKLYFRLSNNKANVKYNILKANISKGQLNIALFMGNNSISFPYELLIRKASLHDTVVCQVWLDDHYGNRRKICKVTKFISGWSNCVCDIIGVITIETDFRSSSSKNNRQKQLDVVTTDYTPEVKDLHEKWTINKEKYFRFKNAGDNLLIATIFMCIFSILIILGLLVYFTKIWPTISSTRRHFVCLLLVLWFNLMLMQPLVMNFMQNLVLSRTGSQYVAWGIIVLYFISAHTWLLGGAQVMIFVGTVNIVLWTIRFFDVLLTLVILVCCCMPLLLISLIFDVAITSINRSTLLPMGYGAGYFVQIPIVFILIVSVMLSLSACFLPRKGSLIMMIAIYPLIFLHSATYYQVMVMRNADDFDFLKYFYYSCGVAVQSIYLIMCLILLTILPLKGLTIYGRNDCNVKLEYIYFINLDKR